MKKRLVKNLTLFFILFVLISFSQVIRANSFFLSSPKIDFFSPQYLNESSINFYQKGDWQKFILQPQQSKYYFANTLKENTLSPQKHYRGFSAYGNIGVNLFYGGSFYTNSKYNQNYNEKASSKLLKNGFNAQNDIRFHLEGRLSERVTMYIDYDQNKDVNKYLVEYQALSPQEVVQKVRIGQLDLKINNSKYAIYDGGSSAVTGIESYFKYGKLRVKAFGAINRGERETETFSGNHINETRKLAEYQYQRKRFYQLEAFKRFDNLTTPPDLVDQPYQKTIALSSKIETESYEPFFVNVDVGSLEIYLDDQNVYNNQGNEINLNFVAGDYSKLQNGVDYLIDYQKGIIEFLKNIKQTDRIFAIYTLNNGSTLSSDPASRTDVFSHKIFVFLKFGSTLNEDLNFNFQRDADEPDSNSDGKLNLDLYELRNVYYLGAPNLLAEKTKIEFFSDNSSLSQTEILQLGGFRLDCQKGFLIFKTREPFKSFLSDSKSKIIYSETLGNNIYNYSQYDLKIEYSKDNRSFQLKHANILEGTERVKINNLLIAKSLYSLDYTTGYLKFLNKNNPLITGATKIEISYEYLPENLFSDSLITGVRTDYLVNKNLQLGTTLLYSGGTGNNIIPDVGKEKTQLTLCEADLNYFATKENFEDFFNKKNPTKKRKIPLELKCYAEGAFSNLIVNSFGKAMIDDLNSSQENLILPLNDNSWILSSLPAEYTQSERGIVFYKYYRDLHNLSHLQTEDFLSQKINYSQKPGPYNLATDHLPTEIQSENPLSLAFDFEFSESQKVVSFMTRKSLGDLDLSGMQYLEISYKPIAGHGNVACRLDLGQFSEDTDGDGQLDSEDSNNNGYLENNEDHGYTFNPLSSFETIVGGGVKLNSATQGDGVLNTEDFNHNGNLDLTESFLQFPSSKTMISKFIINLDQKEWQVVRIYLNRELLNSQDFKILINSLFVRLSLLKENANSGTVYIDNIKFVSSPWTNFTFDELSAYDPTKFRLSFLNNYTDLDYRKNSFLNNQTIEWKKLYGHKSDYQIEKEADGALEIVYNLSSQQGAVSRKFSEEIDISAYQQIEFWLNWQNFTDEDYCFLRIGSSLDDYYEYQIKPEFLGIWQKKQLKIFGKDGITASKISGFPDFKKVKILQIGVKGQNGKLWLSKIQAIEPQSKKGGAWWCEAELKSTDALWQNSAGTEIFPELAIKGLAKGQTNDFSTIGEKNKNAKLQNYEIYTDISFLKGLKQRLNYLLQYQKTDEEKNILESERGKSLAEDLFWNFGYSPQKKNLPHVELQLKHQNLKSEYDEFVKEHDVNVNYHYQTYYPSFVLTERLNFKKLGSLYGEILLDTAYSKEERLKKMKNHLTENIGSFITPEELTNHQQQNLSFDFAYRNKWFALLPRFMIKSKELVGCKKDINSEIKEIKTNYHFPFIYQNGSHFIDKKQTLNSKIEIFPFKFFHPSFEVNYQLYEDNFLEKNILKNYNQTHDNLSSLSKKVTLPFSYQTTQNSLQLVFNISRQLLFEEENVPFQKHHLYWWQENYGTKRNVGTLTNGLLNIYQYPFWYFFSGEGEFQNARKYVDNFQNEKIKIDETKILDYNNNFKIVDNLNILNNYNFSMFNFLFAANLNQICQRMNIFGLASQLLTYSFSTSSSTDLIKIFKIKSSENFLSCLLNLNYMYKVNLLVTSNIKEQVHSPLMGVTFKRNHFSVGINGSLDFRNKKYRPLIKNSSFDKKYLENINTLPNFKERDLTWKCKLNLEMEVDWLYQFFLKFYRLSAKPIFNFEYQMALNNYDYSNFPSPEPYDSFFWQSKLILNLHKNIQGGLIGKMALERFYERESHQINKEIFSYELGLNFSLIF